MFFPYHDNNPTTRPPIFTLGLIAANGLAWLWLLQLGGEMQLAVARYGFVPARIEQLRDPARRVFVEIEQPVERPFRFPAGAVRRRVELDPAQNNAPLTLLTCMFLHGSWMHLIGNMWFLWLYGNNVEDRLGHLLFLVLYLAGGLFASFCHWLSGPQSSVPVIGASGAVAAVLGAYAVTWPHARVRALVVLFVFVTTIELPALVVLGFWFVGQLLEAVGSLHAGVAGGVAFWAHIGGFAAGALAMPLVCRVVPPPRRASGEPRLFPID